MADARSGREAIALPLELAEALHLVGRGGRVEVKVRAHALRAHLAHRMADGREHREADASSEGSPTALDE